MFGRLRGRSVACARLPWHIMAPLLCQNASSWVLRLALVWLAASLPRQAAGQPQQMLPAKDGALPCPASRLQPLTNLSVTGTLAPNCQLSFVVAEAALRDTPCDYSSPSNDSWLQVEVWDVAELAKQNQSGFLSGGAARADPLLLVARGGQPRATYSHQAQWQYDPAGTVVDAQGALLLSPYQQVSVRTNAKSASSRDSRWYLTLQNVALWMNEPLQFHLRVSCSARLACPAPLLQSGAVPGPQCSGHGICAAPSASFLRAARAGNAAAAGNSSSISANDLLDSRANMTQRDSAGDGAGGAGGGGGSDGTGQRGDTGGAMLAGGKPLPVPARVCSCRAGYGDVGCNVPVPMLAQGQVISRIVSIGGWAFTQLDLPEGVQSLLVEMNRTSGDPVLFIKPAAAGFQAGALPTVLDYENFTDSVSFRERLNQHSRLLRFPPAGRVYIAVYNNDVYLQENAHVSLQARWSLLAGAPLCAGNCSSNGVCAAPATCKCFQGYMGARCEGRVAPLMLEEGVGGSVGRGAWAFLTLTLGDEDKSWRKNGLEVRFLASGGHPVLLAQRNGYPTLLHNDFLFRSRDDVYGEQLFRVSEDDLQPGVYTIGIFNMDYFVHQSFSYQLAVESAPGRKFSLTPYFSIIIGVTLSVLLCLLLSFVKRGMRNRRLRRDRTAAVQMGPRPHRDRGVSTALIESLPTREFKASAAVMQPQAGVPVQVALSGLAGAAMPGEPATGASYNECTVCLAEYQDGDTLRTLPCGHFFHAAKCIDRWLLSHSSCPICRASILPEPPGGSDTAIQMPPIAVAGSFVGGGSRRGSLRRSSSRRSSSRRSSPRTGSSSGGDAAVLPMSLQGTLPPSRAEIRNGAEQALQQHLQQQRQADAGAHHQQQHSGQSSAYGPLTMPPRSLPDIEATRTELAEHAAQCSPTAAAQPRTLDRQWAAHPVQLAGRHAAAAVVRTAAPQEQHQPSQSQQQQQQPPPPPPPPLPELQSGAEEMQPRPRGFLAWAGRVGGLRTGWV